VPGTTGSTRGVRAQLTTLTTRSVQKERQSNSANSCFPQTARACGRTRNSLEGRSREPPPDRQGRRLKALARRECLVWDLSAVVYRQGWAYAPTRPVIPLVFQRRTCSGSGRSWYRPRLLERRDSVGFIRATPYEGFTDSLVTPSGDKDGSPQCSFLPTGERPDDSDERGSSGLGKHDRESKRVDWCPRSGCRQWRWRHQ